MIVSVFCGVIVTPIWAINLLRSISLKIYIKKLSPNPLVVIKIYNLIKQKNSWYPPNGFGSL